MKRILTVLFFAAISSSAYAQLNADFTIDRVGGCSPLTVQFTNTTTGASANVKYKWDFGNGNGSGLASPGATYTQEKTYTVTLTVTDAGKTSSKSQQVTVYKKPTADFTLTPASGCLPLDVKFTSTTNPGDGTISGYFWDFGDGKTQSGSTYSDITHKYTFAQKPVISLTVTNSNGCYTTVSKSNQLNLAGAVTASFTSDTKVLCQPGGQVKFTNNSTGDGTLTYNWDFGDGKTSSSTSPVHTYADKGTYTVKLTTLSSVGCQADTVKIDYINVANFAVGFTIPQPLCTNNNMAFTDTSTQGYIDIEWKLDGQQVFPSQNNTGGYIFNFNDNASHTVSLTHSYGTCVLNETKVINAITSPPVPSIIKNVTGACTVPVTVNFSDSTNEAVKWEWFDTYPNMGVPFATGQSATHDYPAASIYNIGLRITNSAGCTDSVWQTVNLQQPVINIYVKNTDSVFSHTGCIGSTFLFSVDQPDVIKSYQWDFGDGSTSTLPYPSHKFTKPGPYPIQLNYVTNNGCIGKATFHYVGIIDNSNINVDFHVLPDSTVCGNTVITFVATQLSGWTYNWEFGDGSIAYNSTSIVPHAYLYDSVYSVRLVVSNEDCRDTMFKPLYIKIKPDFPKIGSLQNTCAGTRGDVTFTDASTKVTQWIWDFGDGTPKVSYNSRLATIKHTYKKTGRYTTVLTGINNGCTVSDSIPVYVLLKQSPKFSSPQSVACGSDAVNFTIDNMDRNPATYAGDGYTVPRMQYGDLTNANNPGIAFTYLPYNGTTTNLSTGQSQLRVITLSGYFNCYDTSNFIPIKIRGPKAGYSFKVNDVCFKKPVLIKDSSKAGPNLPIAKWEWNFGDGTIITNTTNESVTHLYAVPGNYSIGLRVTDTAGCSNAVNGSYGFATVSGPLASFVPSADPVAPNTTVYFSNNTNTYNAPSVSYTWIMPDGKRLHNVSTSFLFQNKGADTLTLIASNNQHHCVDTFVKIIHVKKINTAYTYSLSYINNNNCPPVIANFTSTTVNALRINWDFGDGSHADNQRNVSHTYTSAGVYRVVLYGYDLSNHLDSTEDFIEVKGPYATLNADKLIGCDSATITLSASIRNASSFTWDFGDGTLNRTTDTFSIHTYDIPGVYTPQLILKDGEGCSGTSALQNSIIIDNIDASITKSPAIICDSAIVYFQPAVASVAKDIMHLPLKYHWEFGTGKAADTSNIDSASFRYVGVGIYNASLHIISPYGCSNTITDVVNVQTVSRPGITGPLDICENTSATFKGTATNFNNNLSWHWIYDSTGNGVDGTGYQKPPPVLYKDSGVYNVKLIVNNSGCFDSTTFTLNVHGYPRANIFPQNPGICLGASIQVSAYNGITYSWKPGSNISDAKSASPVVAPKTSMYYYVTTTNASGCSGIDSVYVTVHQPFKVKANPIDVCLGSTGRLQASGADKYIWISGIGLSNDSIPNPVVNTTVSGTYTVVGYDTAGCFTDTARVAVSIKQLPAVAASPRAATINAGTDIQLNTQASGDVVKYAWLPPDYLSCADCGSPLSSPKLPVTYIGKVYNQYGCTAADTVNIKLVCAENLVYIPNAFTPNGDGRNDRFILSGNSIKMVRHIVIYSRMGNKLFEKNYIPTNDIADSWDGTVGGVMQPAGAYVYFAEIECATGEIFKYKGTIILIR